MDATIYLKGFGTPQSRPSFGASIVINVPTQDDPIIYRVWGEAEPCSGKYRSYLTGALVADSVVRSISKKIEGVSFFTDDGAVIRNAGTPASRQTSLDLWAELDATLKGRNISWGFRSADHAPHLQIAGAFARGATGGPYVSRETGVVVPNLYQPYRSTFEGGN